MTEETIDRTVQRERIINQVDAIISHCEENRKPLEVDPARSQLFDLFAEAEQAGMIGEDATPDLSENALCQALSSRWGLHEAAQQSVVQQSRLHEPQLTKMRSLWSVMRMWMEWSYAWERWKEFH